MGGSIPDLEPTPGHLIYLGLSFFLILYALFANFLRNTVHLSEPPLATLTGILLGPEAIDVLGPVEWSFQDNITQEMARVVTCVQVFAVGLELPGGYVKKHWKGLALLLGPNMAYGWVASAVIIHFVLQLEWSTAFIIAATLTPTDPVLSASVLGEAKFSMRVPKRVRNILSAESGCNDGTAFPFLYAAIFYVTQKTTADWSKMFFLDIILWQCTLGAIVGALIGLIAREALKFSSKREYTQDATLFVFYFLLAVFCTGVGSTLGFDDFLVAFSAGIAFAWDGWFQGKTKKMKLPSIIDLLLNSSMFIYFGTIIPWDKMFEIASWWRLLLTGLAIFVLRRFPSMLAIKTAMPEIKTWSEAIFAGHFGPMGVGALFLAMEARGQLESGSSAPSPHPPTEGPHLKAIQAIWPVVSYIVLLSIMIHGFSAAVMSIYGHFRRDPGHRSSVVGGETDRLTGMVDEPDQMTDGSDDDDSDDAKNGTSNGRVRLA